MDFSFGAQDITKSVDQLCAQISMSNITVPSIDNYENIFEFIAEFERATAMLLDSQKGRLLVKAFPSGRYSSWYTSVLKPIIATTSWEALKTKIIERYSDVEDTDRHLKRLDTLKFDPNGNVKLFDYIEELLFSLSKALLIDDEATKIRYIKSRLPSAILPTLSSISYYVNAKTLEDFMKAFRHYDTLKTNNRSLGPSSEEKIKYDELLTVLKDLTVGLKQQASTKVAAAIAPRAHSPDHHQSRDIVQQSSYRREDSPRRTNYHMYRDRSPSPYEGRNQGRSPSPNRPSVGPNYQQHYYPNRDTNYQYSNRNYHTNQPNYNRNSSTTNLQNNSYSRGRSPPPQIVNRNQNYMERNRIEGSPIRRQVASSSCTNDIYNEAYFHRFGVPPYPCQHCQLMHWSRHCPNHLN